jgi:alkylated DNA repair dioxygenase AlkB
MPVLDAAARIERLQLDDRSWVDVVRGLVPTGVADATHDELAATARWIRGRVFRYERWVEEPRLSAWQAGPGRHPVLAEVQAWIEARYRGVRFDGVALARYRDGDDLVAWHRDRELRWLEGAVIGVATFGAQRPFLLRPVGANGGVKRAAADDDLADALDIAPASGDLLVMGGWCQLRWLHAVPPVRDPTLGSRISAQYRWTPRRGRPDTAPGYFAPRYFAAG